MNTEKTGGSAFPTNVNGQLHHSCTENGMTLLDYFAAKAMQAVTATPHSFSEVKDDATCAEFSYKLAAAMIEERKKYINQ